MSLEVAVNIAVLLPLPNSEQYPHMDGSNLVVPTQVWMETYSVPYQIRKMWAFAIERHFYDRDVCDGIEQWDIGLFVDGRVDFRNRDISRASNDAVFPPRFRLPDIALKHCVDAGDRMRRKQVFALGGILYEVLTGKKLFAGITDLRIQYRYEQGMWPEGIHLIPDHLMVMGCWILALPGPLGPWSEEVAHVWGPGHKSKCEIPGRYFIKA
jgi:hypothetical protein